MKALDELFELLDVAEYNLSEPEILRLCVRVAKEAYILDSRANPDNKNITMEKFIADLLKEEGVQI